MRATKAERKAYVLKDEEDFIILYKIKTLEKKNLSKADREILMLCKTQLKKDWRGHLIRYLDKMIKNCQ